MSLGVLSDRRIEKYRFYLGKIGRELAKPRDNLLVNSAVTWEVYLKALGFTKS